MDGLRNIEHAGVGKHKLVVGISLQGRSYTLASPRYHGLGAPVKTWLVGGKPGAYTQTDGLLSYYEVSVSTFKKFL